MKIFGKSLKGPSTAVVVFPRQDGDLVFEAQAVVDFDDFLKLCPAPQAPMMLRRGDKEAQPNLEDRNYLKAKDEWAEKRAAWTIIKSLEVTKGLEWDTVDMNDSNTWANYKQELTDSGLTLMEISGILRIITEVNGLDQSRIDEATKRFLATRAQAQESESSQNIEQQNTPSGDPANVSE